MDRGILATRRLAFGRASGVLRPMGISKLLYPASSLQIAPRTIRLQPRGIQAKPKMPGKTINYVDLVSQGGLGGGGRLRKGNMARSPGQIRPESGGHRLRAGDLDRIETSEAALHTMGIGSCLTEAKYLRRAAL